MVNSRKKFQEYLFGRNLVISSDHHTLAALFGLAMPMSVMLVAHMQRRALLLLAAYGYRWVCRKGCDVGNTDAPSRLPLANKDVSCYVK